MFIEEDQKILIENLQKKLDEKRLELKNTEEWEFLDDDKNLKTNSPKYKAYMRSAAYFYLKKIREQIDGCKCAKCFSLENLQFHHLHYRNLYKELLTDGITLCKFCHHAGHEVKKKIFSKGSYMKLDMESSKLGVLINSILGYKGEVFSQQYAMDNFFGNHGKTPELLSKLVALGLLRRRGKEYTITPEMRMKTARDLFDMIQEVNQCTLENKLSTKNRIKSPDVHAILKKYYDDVRIWNMMQTAAASGLVDRGYGKKKAKDSRKEISRENIIFDSRQDLSIASENTSVNKSFIENVQDIFMQTAKEMEFLPNGTVKLYR